MPTRCPQFPHCAYKSDSVFQLLYATPVGSAQLNARGDIELVNPEFARLAQIACRGENLGNFFELVRELAPALRARAEAAAPATERILDDEIIELPQAMEGVEALACTLTKTQAGGYFVVLRDATQTVTRERNLSKLSPP